jgi:hypothetical protein
MSTSLSQGEPVQADAFGARALMGQLLLLVRHAELGRDIPLQRHLTMVRLDPLFPPVPFDAKDTLDRFFAGPTRPTAARYTSCGF